MGVTAKAGLAGVGVGQGVEAGLEVGTAVEAFFQDDADAAVAEVIERQRPRNRCASAFRVQRKTDELEERDYWVV